MISKKGYIILVSLLAVYLIGSLLYTALHKEEKLSILFNNGDEIIYFKDKTWDKMKETKEIYENYNIYVNGEKFSSKSKLKFQKNENNWSIYDKNFNVLKKDGSLIAFNGNLPYSVYKFKEQEISQTDEDIIKEYLKSKKKSNIFKNIGCTYYDIDIDSDNKMDRLYVCNMNTSDSSLGAISLAFIKINGKIYDVYYNYFGFKEATAVTNVPYVLLDQVIDAGNDGNKELFFRMEYQADYTCLYGINFLNGKINKLSSC